MVSRLFTLTDDELASFAITIGILALVATSVVVAGLVFEYYGSQSDAKTDWYPLTGGPPRFWDAERIGDVLVIIGVSGELLFGVTAFILSTTLDTNRQRHIEEL